MTQSRDDPDAVRLRYEEGTVRIDGLGRSLVDRVREAVPELEADPRTDGWRVPGYRYAVLRAALAEAFEGDGGVDDRVLDLDPIPALESSYELRSYQREALEAWLETDRTAGAGATATDPAVRAPAGALELPTGSGKTVVGLAAIERLAVPTLVVVPTIDLLEQWERELEREFDCKVGRFGGGEQRRESLTVSTYDSAYLKADSVGDRFGLVVFDEVHHLGGEGYREIASLLAAPARLGLTATFERADGAHEVLEDLVGPLVHRIPVEQLTGEHLSAYDVKRRTVSLTDEEREAYERNQSIFTDYLARSSIELREGSDYQELVKRSGRNPEAREALLARQRAREIVYGSEAKLAALAEILGDHRPDRTIVFTAHNDLAYDVSERFLMPAITHQTDATLADGRGEREAILDRFRNGEYSRIVTTNVLDEGIDVPEANVGVILSGSGSKREYRQRLGRILRPTADGRSAVLYEVVAEGTSEERTAGRRRD